MLNRNVIFRAIAVALFSAVLAACSGADAPDFRGTDITGTHLGRAMALTDHNGQPRTLDSFKGRVTVVFFGFTQCPDVCPTALAEMSEVMKRLGEKSDDVQVLMISVDPERDTADVLKSYMVAFDPRFLGLRGSDSELKATAGAFKAYYAKAQQSGGNYSMDHTAAFYIIDKKGEARVLASNTLGAEALAHDIEQLL